MFSIVFVRRKWDQIFRHCEWKNVILLAKSVGPFTSVAVMMSLMLGLTLLFLTHGFL